MKINLNLRSKIFLKDLLLPSAPQAHPLYARQAAGNAAPAFVMGLLGLFGFVLSNFMLCRTCICIATISFGHLMIIRCNCMSDYYQLKYLSIVMLLHLFIVLLERILLLHQRCDLSLERESSSHSLRNIHQ